MELLLICGFDGETKNAFARETIEYCKKTGIKAALIENTTGIGDETGKVDKGSTTIRNIGGGCVCCELASSLIVTMCEIDEYVDPRWCFLVLPMVAEVPAILKSLRTYYRPDLKISTMAVFEKKKWNKLRKMKAPYVEGLIKDADVIYLSGQGEVSSLLEENQVRKIVTRPEEIWGWL